MNEANITLKQAQEKHQLMLSKVSHEIRNPVTLINSFLQMFSEKHPEVKDFEYWDDIMDNMNYLILLLEDLSSYNNANRLSKEPIYMDVFLEKLAASVRPVLQYLNIRLDCRFSGSLPILDADERKLRQVMLNLIRNAEEALPSPKVIILSAAIEENQCVLRIEDDGGGIPEEHLATIFEPFVTYKPEGTGLGLAVAKHIIEAHGGSIGVDTGDWGTAFTLRLPITNQDYDYN